MGVIARVPFAKLGMPGIFLSFIGNDPVLAKQFPKQPAGPREVLELAKARLASGVFAEGRIELADCLAAYANSHEADAAVLQAAESLAVPGTVAIVTGQQPGLFGGPLYIWHKVATALRLASDIRKLPGAPRVVTIFWNHSEDHDWGEANHTYLVNVALDLQRVRLGLPSTRTALFDLPMGSRLDEALDAACDLLPETEFSEEVIALHRPRSDEETLGQQLSRLLFRYFGSEGLLILEPYLLPASFRSLLSAYQDKSTELRALLKGGVEELSARGFDITVDPEAAFLFSIENGGKRSALPDGEALPSGHMLSPGVLLRNIWQDHILPSIASVVGPGELSYLALSGAIYHCLGVGRPVLIPRVSMTHVPTRLSGYLERWGLTLPDLEHGARWVEEWIAAREDAGGDEQGALDRPEAVLSELALDFRDKLKGLEAGIGRVDRNLLVPLARLSSRLSSELLKLGEKVNRQRRNQAGTYRQHARRLCAELLPRGRLQERVLPGLPFLIRSGSGFAKHLMELADPFERAHLLCSETVQ